MQIGVIGDGAFGNAIAHVLRSNGMTPEVVGPNTAFSTPRSVVFVAVPSRLLADALAAHTTTITSDTTIINCVKGLVNDPPRLPQEIISAVFPESPYATLAGPSFASEMVAAIPTVVNIGTHSDTAFAQLAEMLQNDWFLLERTHSIRELELAGVLKNIYAVAAGVVSASGGGKNTIAHLQVVALREFVSLVEAFAGDASVVSPGVVGDLLLTCNSPESRNYRFGVALVSGTPVAFTAEGVDSAPAAATLAVSQGVALPLVHAVATAVTTCQPEAAVDIMRALGFNTLV